MNIAEIAQAAGVSKQAVYQRLKKNGIKIDTIKDPKSGEISAKDAAVIVGMFTGSDTNEVDIDSIKGKAVNVIDEYKSAVESLNAEIAGLKQKVNELTNERDFLRNSLLQAQNALSQAQQLQAMTLQRVLSEPKQGVTGRFFSFFSRKKTDEQ